MKKLIIALVSLSFFVSPLANAKRVTCKSFKTQQQAQAYYQKRKSAGLTGWKSLDRDKDGRACDCLPGGSRKTCPKKK